MVDGVIMLLVISFAVDMRYLAGNPNSPWGIASGLIYVLLGVLLLVDAEQSKAPTVMAWIVLIGGCFWTVFRVVRFVKNRDTTRPPSQE